MIEATTVKKSEKPVDRFPPPPAGKTGWPWTADMPVFPQLMPDGTPWPRISIVTPSYNQGEFLEETIRSVLLQGYPNLEYIIMDGGSSDESVEIIRKYKPWLSYWVSERDGGQAQAINSGIRRSTGELFGYINSDDYYLPRAFEKIANRFSEESKNTFWMGGVVVNIDGRGKELGRKGNILGATPFDWVLHRLSPKGTQIQQPGNFWSLRLFNELGPFDENLVCSFDYEFFVRMYVAGLLPVEMAHPLAVFRIHGEGKTTSMRHAFIEEDLVIANRYQEALPQEIRRSAIRRMRLMELKGVITKKVLDKNASRFDLLRCAVSSFASLPEVAFWPTYYRLVLGIGSPRALKLLSR